ncbi:dienelactone hydrolase [Caenimonas sedimenti]|uniref:Dienelactone hydrolase n=1 Tax=Caenimonas sedimenti TaxID=2596921 RepID=A0A562ZSS5_9BURK|nr:alpha/beta hydrolase [Caenimonas sedimenti]TWO71573.1 dienelactone hydrolase [Caenimonas sedimenti]
MVIARLLLACALAACMGQTQARLIEEVVQLPVRVEDMHGKPVTHTIVVTIFHDDAMPRPYPLAVLGHGRSGKAEERASFGRARYTAHSRWLTQQGFIVAVPTRIGYGDTGGPDVEASGPCSKRNYPPGYQAAADQTLAVIALLRARPDVSGDRGVVLGQSYGGATALAVAARNPPGVQLAINFAGGGGGNPETSPQQPCQPALLGRMFSGFGQSARIPTLWIYSENDMYFGPTHPRTWFEAYRAGGGPGEFVQFPPFGADGHRLFADGAELWRPRVLEFLRTHGFAQGREPR